MRKLIALALTASLLPSVSLAETWCAEPGGAYAERLVVDEFGYTAGDWRCDWANAERTLQACEDYPTPHRVAMEVKGDTLWYDYGRVSAGPQPYRRCD